MISHLKLIPNQLTALRFFTIPVLWVCALGGQLSYIGIGLIGGLISDLLDGAAARRLNQCTDFGSKFDSLADQFLQISALIWVIMLMPEIITENYLISLFAITLYLMSLSVGLVKYKRMANLHLYLSKVGGLFLYIFLIHAFTFGKYNGYLFILAGILFIISSAETLTLQLILPRVDSNIGSILFLYIDDNHPIRYWLSRLP